MRALQVLQAAARQPGPTTLGAAAVRRTGPGRRTARCVVVVAGGVLWWWAVLRLAAAPEAAGSWRGGLAAGGWSLGLIPLHAVRSR